MLIAMLAAFGQLAEIHCAQRRPARPSPSVLPLNVHSKASLYEAFPAAEARRLVERFWFKTAISADQ